MIAVLAFLGSMAVLLPLGVPICFVLVCCAIVLMQVVGMPDSIIVAQNMVSGTNNFALMAIPFFMLAGEIMGAGGLSRRIVDFANVIIGRVRGGLGYATILASMLFAGLSGSAVADAAALGGILVPLMVSNGYRKDRSTGIVCAGSVIAPIIPPSIPMIVLATATGLSVSRCFMAGIVPGIILGLVLMLGWAYYVKKDNYQDRRTYTKAESIKILKESLPALFMPVLIVGGIRLGVFTPTEAGAFATVYAAIISVFVYKELDLKGLFDVCIAGTVSTGTVMIIVAAATGVGWLITIAQIPAMVVKLLAPLVIHPLLLLLLINLFLFVMGMVMDLTPNILIFGPILVPLVKAAGIDPIFFAVIMVLNLTIGLITPPVGIVIYLGCGVSGLDFKSCVKGILPFCLIEIATLFLFCFFPQLITAPLAFLT